MSRSLLLAGLLCASALLSGCTQESAASAITEPAKSGTTKAEPVVAGSPERKGLVLTTTQPGRIEAFETTPLFAMVNGYVGEVLADIGDHVEKGQVLARIAVPELEDERLRKEALVAQAKAEVGQAEAALEAAEAVLISSQAKVEQAVAGTARAEAEFERWREESGRIDRLAASGSVTQKVADETRNQFRSADAARKETAAMVRSAESGVKEGQAGVQKAKADIVAAKARQAVAEASLKQTETMLAYREITAPFGGIVTRRGVDTGHYVAVGRDAGPLFTIARADRVRVFLDVPELEAAQVDIGDKAIVRVQALADAEVRGDVTRTTWALDAANRSLRVEVDLDNPDGRLRPGMYVTAAIQLEARDGVLTLPVGALARKPEGVNCFVIRDGKAIQRPVELGLRVGSDFEVISGLTGDETVAMAKAESLVDGQAVEAVAPAVP